MFFVCLSFSSLFFFQGIMVHHSGRVSIIGAGTLGGTIAYGLMMGNIVKEILLVDRSNNIVQGQVLDLSEAAANTGIIIRAGTFKEASQSSLIIVTADTEPIKDEDRQNWLIRSRRLFLSIASSLSPIPNDIMILVASDPVDLYVQSFQSYFPHVPPTRIFGIGTTMATDRFNTWLSEMTNISNKDAITDAYCIGNQKNPIVVWNYAKINNEFISAIPLLVSERSTLEKIVSEHRNLLIRERKGRAWYGTAATITRLTKVLLGFTQQSSSIQMQGKGKGKEESNSTTDVLATSDTLKQHIWVLSAHVPRFDSCISWPVIVSTGGIKKIIDLPLDSNDSAKVLKVVESNSFDFHSSMGRS